MNNPTIEFDLAEILKEMRSDQKLMLKEIETIKINQITFENNLSRKIETLDEKFSSKVEILDSNLSGKLEVFNSSLSGKIETLGGRFEQLDKRLSNVEFTNRGVFTGIMIIVLGGAVKLLGFFP